MIFGLCAAIGWGLSDVWAALSGRRIGSLRTVVLAQLAAALVTSMLVIAARPDLSRLSGVVAWLVPNAFFSALGFAALYRGLELGPLAVVSPVLATYAVVPVLLSVVLLGETLRPVALLGVVVTISGAVLTSTDIRALRAGTHARPEGLPWAIVSTLAFGVATYITGWAAQQAGVLPSLWFGKVTMAVVLVGAAAVARRMRPARDGRPPLGRSTVGLTVAVGMAELIGTASYAYGAEVGLVSIVTAASATYPLLPVIGGVMMFHERPAPTQYVGVAMVIGGLIALAVA